MDMSYASAKRAPLTMKRRMLRYAVGVVGIVVLLFAAVCVALYFLQNSLVFPGSHRQGMANVQVEVPTGGELVRLSSSRGVPLVGVFGTAKVDAGGDDPLAGSRPTVLFFYGNGDALPSAVYHFELFRRLGANCMIIDYEGYGMSGGSPSEAGCYAAAEAAYQYVLSRPEVNRSKLVPAGFSLGGAVAIDLAHRHRGDGTIAGLITFSTFTTLRDMAVRGYAWVPAGLLLKYQFDSEKKVGALRLPYFVGHGGKDTAIPPEFSERLAVAAEKGGARVTRFWWAEGTHVNFFEPAEQELKPALGVFLRGL